MMRVADGDGQRIGDVMGFGNLGEIEQDGHHALNLKFLSATVSDGRTLDFQGRVFGDGHAHPRCQKQDDTAHMAELKGALGIDRCERFFQRDSFGSKAI